MLLNREDVDITGTMLVALAYSTDAEMVELGLNKRKHRITTQVVEAAQENEQYHLEVLNLLLSKSASPVFDRRVSSGARDERKEQELAKLFVRGHLTNADLQRSIEDKKQGMQQLRNVKANPTSLTMAQLDVKSISFQVPISGKI